VVRGAAGFYLQAGNLAEAEPHLRRIIDRKLKVQDGDVAWAQRTLAVALAEAGGHRRLPQALAPVRLGGGEKGAVTEPKAAGPVPVEDQRARAQVLASQNRRPLRARAVALLEDLQKRQALTPADRFLLARLYQGAGPEDVWWAKAREQF